MRPFIRICLFALLTAVVGLVTWSTSSCLDVTPIIVERESAAVGTECVRCLESPNGCAGLIAKCRADPEYPTCGPIYDCMVERACLDLPILDDKIRCGLPCAQEAGVVSTDDPIVTNYMLGLVICAQQNCPAECNLTEGGVGP